MIKQSPTSRQWLMTAIICGIGAMVTYVIPTQVPLPGMQLTYLIFMAFGPFFSAGVFAIYMYLCVDRNSVPLTMGAVFLVLAGPISAIMAAMQGALRISFENLPHDPEVLSESALIAWKMGFQSGNSLQLGVDVAWDYFVLTGLILWGIAFMRQREFGHWFGWPAVALGVIGMVFNCWTFPDPPGAQGLLDVGPLVGIWFSIVTVRMILSLKNEFRRSESLS